MTPFRHYRELYLITYNPSQGGLDKREVWEAARKAIFRFPWMRVLIASSWTDLAGLMPDYTIVLLDEVDDLTPDMAREVKSVLRTPQAKQMCLGRFMNMLAELSSFRQQDEEVARVTAIVRAVLREEKKQ